MPLRPLNPSGSTSKLKPLDVTTAPDAPAPDEGGGVSPVAGLLGVAGLAGAGYLAHRVPGVPQAMKTGLEYANTFRQQLMLSGLAPLKSLLGNAGAAVETSLEGRSLAPIKAFLSPQTVRDAVAEYKLNPAPSTSGVNLPNWMPTPGRVMQALDTATQGALRRGGLSAKDAERAVLQAPLDPRMAKALDNPVARYMIPFRRTPFNQFIEGFSTIGEDPLLSAGYAGVGAVHGAATADDDMPLSIPLAISGAARRGVSYGVGTLAGRALAGGNVSTGASAGSLLPVSEYGLTQSVTDPLAPYTKPAALAALDKILGR